MIIKRVFGYFAIVALGVALLFSPFFDKKTDEIYTYSDGSIVVHGGGPLYFHHLFDGYGIEHMDTFLGDHLYWTPEETVREYWSHDASSAGVQPETVGKAGYYATYAFDPAGYVACFKITGDKDLRPKGSPYQLKIFDSQPTYVKQACAVLYDCSNRTETTFPTLGELKDYCGEHGISLGDWYHSGGAGVVQEKTALEAGRLSIMHSLYDSHVRLDGKDMFVGKIKRYSFAQNVLCFRLQINDDMDWYPILLNTVIRFDPNNVADLHYDKYVALDCESGEYQLFDTKKELKAYAKARRLPLKWKRNRLD